MVLGRRGLSAILLAVAGLVFYVVFLAVLVTELSAQVGEPDEGCPNPELVDTFTGTENQITPEFEITGDTFRVSYEIIDLDENSKSSSTFSIVPIGGNGPPGNSVFVFEEGSDSVNILQGNDTFSLEIGSDGFEYTVTVEDCVGDDSDTGEESVSSAVAEQSIAEQSVAAQSPSNPSARPRRDNVIRNTIPRRRLPPTGGLSTYAMVTGSILVGTGLLGLGLVVRRGSRD